MSAHTPGPLVVRVGANGDVGIIATEVIARGDTDIGGALIAECFAEIRRADEGARAEALANATLFAASHDLVAALERTRSLLAIAEGQFPPEFNAKVREAVTQARLALAKAGAADQLASYAAPRDATGLRAARKFERLADETSAAIAKAGGAS